VCIARHRQRRADLFFITRRRTPRPPNRHGSRPSPGDGRPISTWKSKMDISQRLIYRRCRVRDTRWPAGRLAGWLAGWTACWLSYNPRLREQYLKLSGFLFLRCPAPPRPPSRRLLLEPLPRRPGGAARERHSAGGRPGDDPASYSSYPPNNYRWDRGCHLSSFSSGRSDPPPLPSHWRSPGEPSAGTEAR